MCLAIVDMLGWFEWQVVTWTTCFRCFYHQVHHLASDKCPYQDYDCIISL